MLSNCTCEIYFTICVPKIVKIVRFDKVIAKTEG